MWQRIKKHRVVTTTVGALAFFGTIWGMFFKDTLPEIITKEGWIDAMPSWYYLFVLLLGIAVICLQIVLIRDVREKKRSLAWLESLANEDEQFIDQRILISELRIKDKVLRVAEPYVDIEVVGVYNASIYSITLSKEVTGKAEFLGSPLHFSPEIITPGRSHLNIKHASGLSLILRQRISPETATLMEQKGKTQLSTGKIALWFTYQDRSGNMRKVRRAIGNLASDS